MAALKKLVGRCIFKLAGWQYDVDPTLLEDRQVLIGFEHTSNLDAVLSLALFAILEIKIHTLIKKELFKGPLKPLLHCIGGIPVDRKNKQDIVAQMVALFQSETEFSLVIAPEATRAKNSSQRNSIRTGFWHIAKAAQVPIVLMYADAGSKRGGVFAKIYPTQLEHDLLLIKAKYAELGIEVKIN
jgi:1-acyl-sn-glycerol-3-phosphate acyltransferase